MAEITDLPWSSREEATPLRNGDGFDLAHYHDSADRLLKVEELAEKPWYLEFKKPPVIETIQQPRALSELDGLSDYETIQNVSSLMQHLHEQAIEESKMWDIESDERKAA